MALLLLCIAVLTFGASQALGQSAAGPAASAAQPTGRLLPGCTVVYAADEAAALGGNNEDDTTH